MRWTEAENNWGEVAGMIATTFPAAEYDHLRNIGPDADRVITHIAERHHLTKAEARETLEERVLIQPLEDVRYAAE